MKYALLAFGIVLMIGGALSIYSGYGIIEMERGWAAVLAGATAITGGSITIGLALILQSLDRLRAALENSAARPELNRLAHEPFVEMTEETEPVITELIPDLPKEPEPAAPSPATAAAKPEEPNPLTEVAVDLRTPQPPPLAAEFAERAPAPKERPAAKIRKLPRAATAFADAATKAQAAPSIDQLWQQVAADMSSMRLGQSKEEPHTPVQPEPIQGDWLDQALAGLEPAATPKPIDPEPEAPPLVPEAEQPPEELQLKVIGRYEADGTVYVMFADGSIEAQSAQGVYRFASITELKAYFQT